MKISKVQQVITILKASTEDSSVSEKRVPKPEPKKSKKVLVKAKQVRKG